MYKQIKENGMNIKLIWNQKKKYIGISMQP